MLGLKVETHRETQARRGLQRPRQAFALRLSAPRPEAVSSSARHVEGSQWDRAAGCGHGLRWFFATAARVRPVRARMGARVGFLSLYGFSCLRRHFTPWIAKCHPPGCHAPYLIKGWNPAFGPWLLTSGVQTHTPPAGPARLSLASVPGRGRTRRLLGLARSVPSLGMASVFLCGAGDGRHGLTHSPASARALPPPAHARMMCCLQFSLHFNFNFSRVSQIFPLLFLPGMAENKKKKVFGLFHHGLTI